VDATVGAAPFEDLQQHWDRQGAYHVPNSFQVPLHTLRHKNTSRSCAGIAKMEHNTAAEHSCNANGRSRKEASSRAPRSCKWKFRTQAMHGFTSGAKNLPGFELRRRQSMRFGHRKIYPLLHKCSRYAQCSALSAICAVNHRIGRWVLVKRFCVPCIPSFLLAR